MKLLNIPVFIISLAVGLFVVYITSPPTQIIYVYPTPENIDKIQYKDESGTCFGFSTNEIACPQKETSIRKYPVQSFQQSQK